MRGEGKKGLKTAVEVGYEVCVKGRKEKERMILEILWV